MWLIIMPPCLPESLHHPVMSSSGDDWLTDSSDHELGHLGDDVGGVCSRVKWRRDQSEEIPLQRIEKLERSDMLGGYFSSPLSSQVCWLSSSKR